MRSIRVPLAERFIDGSGAMYVCFADGVERPDGRYDVRLLFAGEQRSYVTAKPQTTQSNDADVSRWAQGLSAAHIANAFREASGSGPASPEPLPVPESTPSNIDEFIDNAFRQRAAETIETRTLFDSGTFANADVIRELQRLEQEGRIVRFTWNGTDYVSRASMQPRRTLGPDKTPSNEPVVPPRLFTMHSTPVRARGSEYRAYVFGLQRADGTWTGWIEFRDGDDGVLKTGEETSQPNETAFAYWASGLEATYLEGAIKRAT